MGAIVADHSTLAECRRRLALDPDSPSASFALGEALVRAGAYDEAIDQLTRLLRRVPDGAIGHEAAIMLGNVLRTVGRTADALLAFRHAVDLSPFTVLRPPRTPTSPRLLFLFAPGLYNTPYTYLAEHEDYGVTILMLMTGIVYDPDYLRSWGDIIVNLVSDADHDKDVLSAANDVVGALGMECVNHPGRILRTDRERVAVLLSDIPHCRVAKISRHTGQQLLFTDLSAGAEPRAFPLLARKVGFHNGAEFRKLESARDLQVFVGRDPFVEYYLIDYMDYASGDGYYRKYRFFIVDGKIFPYHLAIGSDWKVHHVTTDLAHRAWMQEEEAAFLAAPQSIFGPAQLAVLHAIDGILGLEFWGIDCAIDAGGRVVVFEANATMLVHAEEGALAYRNPYVLRIKEAFNAMIAARTPR